jgi:hypothetical protein
MSTILGALIATARDLNEPGEPNNEYARGQAELIVDACGLEMDGAREHVQDCITHKITRDELWGHIGQ